MIVRDKSFKVFGPVHLRVHLGQDVFLPEGRWTVESEHRRGERNRRQTGSMYTPAYRVLVSSEFQLHPPADRDRVCERADDMDP